MPNEVTRLAKYVNTMKANPAIAQKESQQPVDGIAALAAQMYNSAPKPKAPVSYPEGTALMKATAQTPAQASGGLAEIFSQAAKNPKLAPYVDHLVELAKRFKAENPDASEEELGKAVFSSAPPEIKQAILNLAYEHVGGEQAPEQKFDEGGFLPKLTDYILGDPTREFIGKQSADKWNENVGKAVNRIPHTMSGGISYDPSTMSEVGNKWLEYAKKAEAEGDPSPMQQLKMLAENLNPFAEGPLLSVHKKGEKSSVKDNKYKPEKTEDKPDDRPLVERIKEAGKGFFTLRKKDEKSDITAKGYEPKIERPKGIAATTPAKDKASVPAKGIGSTKQAEFVGPPAPQRQSVDGIAKIAQQQYGPSETLMNPSSQIVSDAAPQQPQYDESMPDQAVQKIMSLYALPQYSPQIMEMLKQGKRNEMLNTALGMLAGTGAGLSQRNMNEGLADANLLAGNAFTRGMDRANQAEHEWLNAQIANEMAPIDMRNKAVDAYLGMQAKDADRRAMLQHYNMVGEYGLADQILANQGALAAAQARASGVNNELKQQMAALRLKKDAASKLLSSLDTSLGLEGKSLAEKLTNDDYLRAYNELLDVSREINRIGGDLGLAGGTGMGEQAPTNEVMTLGDNGKLIPQTPTP